MQSSTIWILLSMFFAANVCCCSDSCHIFYLNCCMHMLSTSVVALFNNQQSITSGPATPSSTTWMRWRMHAAANAVRELCHPTASTAVCHPTASGVFEAHDWSFSNKKINRSSTSGPNPVLFLFIFMGYILNAHVCIAASIIMVRFNILHLNINYKASI